ncbi:cell surface protein [Nonlabens arenilitoris]|uniref:Cell surface protein n=1 Tax=Nonlabens arenilitoris TaxID=1217969 RepID=A0A2S7UBE0_9FLAO|nr:T9SS type A sorting domain-containing protein [Nonlabens arenilitoris]PQJ32236.1 cell surface protein [Nonlabens arenilitoris]
MKRILLLTVLLLTTIATAQVTAGPVPDYILCDDVSNDGTELFDLTFWDATAIGNQSPATHSATYFSSQFDAVNNLNQLPMANYSNVTNPELIFIRVDDNATGNFNITTGNLIVETLPVVNNLQSFTYCGSITATGEVQVDLYDIEPFMSNGQNNLLFTYFLSQQDADSNSNPLSTTFIHQANSPVDLFIRVQTSLNCHIVINVVAILTDCNQNTQVVDLEECEDQNNSACFDLNVNDFPALGTLSPNQYSVTYHISQVDADNNVNPLTSPYCTSTSQPIFVRVHDITTGSGDTSQSFNLVISPAPPVFNLTPITGCDDDGDGFIDWDSSAVLAEIDATATPNIDSAFTEYYLTQQDALDRVNLIGFGANFSTTAAVSQVYVRTDFFPSGCASASPLQLITDPNCFSIGNPSHLLQCADPGVQVCFDLTQHAGQIMANNNPTDFSISYHLSDADANTDTSAISAPNNYCINSNQIIYFRLEENATGAYRVGSFDLFINTYTYDNTVSLILDECDTDLNGNVDFDLTLIATQLNAGAILSYYEDPIDAQNETQAITNPSLYNLPVNSQFNTVYVRETVAGDCDLIYTIQLNAQGNCNNSYLCENALSLCDRIGQPFVNIADNSNAQLGNYYPFSQSTGPRNPSWFYIPIETSGDLTIEVWQNTQPDFLGQDLDIDYALYGPFTTATGGCANGLTQANYVDHSFSVNMPEIGQINNAQSGEYYLLLTSNFSNTAGFLKVEIGAGSTATVNCDGIRMQSILDVNLNGVVDATDVPFPLGIFDWEKNMNGSVMQVVTPLSAYTIYDSDPANSYDLGYNVIPAYASNYTVSPATYSAQSIPAGSGVTTRDFLVTPLAAYEDVVVYIIPQQQPRPGFTYKETVVYANLGTTPVATGQLQFSYDPQLSIVAVDDPTAVINPTSVDLNYTNLLPFEYRTMEIEMQIPVIPNINLGDILTNTASITPVANDITPLNNTSVSSQIVIGSYDPNDKMESRGAFINPSEFGPSDYFYYTIRFENTGTASAINVRVEDTLDAQLDWSTLEMINSSHNYVMEQMEEQVVWRFDNILLPDSTTDPVGANGYIYFKIKPLASSEGTVIPNTAEIYFDFNPPIITNTFTSTFRTPLSIDEPAVVNFSLIPNPTSGIVQVNLQNAVLDNAQVVLYDVRGRITLSRKLTNNNPQLDFTDLPAGIYIAELRNGDQTYTTKVVKQ